MAADDTIKNRLNQVKGKAKDFAGKVTKKIRLRVSGKRDMASGEVKQRGVTVKDNITRG